MVSSAVSRGALAALVVLAACGGGGDDTPMSTTSDAATRCDPVMQTGCMQGEKCTWLVDIDADPTNNTNEVGHIGCVAAGPLGDAANCDDARAGVADACAAGFLCVTNQCKPICDPQVLDGVQLAGSCTTDYACATYGGIFASTGAPAAGVCEPACDPLTQRLTIGTQTEACGSADPTEPTATCIASSSFLSFHCAPTVADSAGRTDREAPFTTADGTVYANGCAPGFIPYYYEDASGAMNTLCTGLCAPLKVDATIAAAAGHKADAKGDPSALGKLAADATPVAGHATCNPGIKGSQAAEDCRFLWFPLAGGDPSHATTSPFNDSLGLCYAYDKFLTVTLPGKPDKVAEKSCADLPATAPDNDPYGSARDNGCYPLSDSHAAHGRRANRFRLANGVGPAVRHTFD